MDSPEKDDMSELIDFQKQSALEAADDPSDVQSLPPLGSALKVLMIWPRFPSSFLEL